MQRLQTQAHTVRTRTREHTRPLSYSSIKPSISEKTKIETDIFNFNFCFLHFLYFPLLFFFFLLVLVFSIHALKITALLEIISDNKTKLRSASFYPLIELPKKNYNLRGLLKILCKTDFYFQSKSPFIYDLYSLLFLNKKLIYLIFKSKKSIL